MITHMLCSSVQEYIPLCKEIIATIPQGEIILLRGDLGSGKTTFVQTFVAELGININVDSPTFSIQNSYSETFFHYDIYRKNLSELIALGIFEEFDRQGWHFVEWGSDEFGKILNQYGYSFTIIELTLTQEGRDVVITYPQP